MPLFDYTGQLQSGATFQGTLEAESQQHADATLADMGVRVRSLRPVKRMSYVAPLSLDDFLFFNEQIAAMTNAGVPLQDGLRQLGADVGSGKLKRLLLELADDLAAGTRLEQALVKLQSRFPTQYAGVVRAGLESGDLGGTLYGLSTHLRLKSDLRRALVELAVYPVVVLLFAFGVLSFLMRMVVPQLELMVADVMGVAGWTPGSRSFALPQSTWWILETARAWPTIELVLLGLLTAVVLFVAGTCLPGGRGVREWLLRRMPGIARVYWSSVLARFTHTSALAAFSGTPLPELLASSGAASGSVSLATTARAVAKKLSAGLALEEASRGQRDIPALWTCVVSATAARGELPAALEELARTYEQRAREWSGVVRVILGPVLLLAVGLFLGLVIVGLVLPLIHLIQGLTG
ncbi:MAG: type II secretion system F family protein [Planctomycetes bacterium]|nr:type II secretion system F family protein [Planctomycetota bacterium]